MTTKLSKQQLMMSLITATINSADFTQLEGWDEYVDAARKLSELDIPLHPMNVHPHTGASLALKQVTDWMKNVIKKNGG